MCMSLHHILHVLPLDHMHWRCIPLVQSASYSLLIVCAWCCKVLPLADDKWQPSTTAVTYTSTTHSGVSYRPGTASSRPFTAHPHSPRAVPNSRQARPASARESSSRRSVASLAGGLKGKATMAPDVLQSDTTHLQITKLLYSRGRRSVSPMSDGSSGATPSPAQTPCSVLSRPNTAGSGWHTAYALSQVLLEGMLNQGADMQDCLHELSCFACDVQCAWWLQPMLSHVAMCFLVLCVQCMSCYAAVARLITCLSKQLYDRAYCVDRSQERPPASQKSV